MNETTGFGPHLTLDMYGCDSVKLTDAGFIYSLLDGLPSLIGMNKISKPSVRKFRSNPLGRSGSFDQGGISAFVLIAESHITVHTFAAQRFASVDIFSCRPFDAGFAVRYLMKSFGASKAEKNLFDRGREFPKSVPLAKPLVAAERRGIASARK